MQTAISMADPVVNLTFDEQQLLDKHLSFYEDLETGQRNPETEAQEHFVEVCQGRAKASNDHELAYVKYMRLRAKSRREQEEQQDSSNSIPEYEEGLPKPGWFTDEDWKKMRKGDYADMKSRSRS